MHDGSPTTPSRRRVRQYRGKGRSSIAEQSKAKNASNNNNNNHHHHHHHNNNNSSNDNNSSSMNVNDNYIETTIVLAPSVIDPLKDAVEQGNLTPLQEAAGLLLTFEERQDYSRKKSILEHEAGRASVGLLLLFHAMHVKDSPKIRETIKFLVQGCAIKINTRQNGKGKMAIHEAARVGGSARTQVLLSLDADPNAQDDEGDTPLHHAARSGDAETVKLLLSLPQVDSSILNLNGESVAAIAIKKAEAEGKVAEELSSSVQPRLLLAAANGRVGEMLALLHLGAKINGSHRGRQAMHCAAGNGHLHIVSALYSRGGDVNPLDDEHRTPIMHAAASGHHSVVSFLIDRKAKTDEADMQGRTLLHHACMSGNPDLVDLVLKHLSVKRPISELLQEADNKGVNALLWAAKMCRSKALAYLLTLEGGKEAVKARTTSRQTALHLCTLHQDKETSETIECVQQLLRFVDPRDVDENGQNPLQLIVQANQIQAKKKISDMMSLALYRFHWQYQVSALQIQRTIKQHWSRACLTYLKHMDIKRMEGECALKLQSCYRQRQSRRLTAQMVLARCVVSSVEPTAVKVKLMPWLSRELLRCVAFRLNKNPSNDGPTVFSLEREPWSKLIRAATYIQLKWYLHAVKRKIKQKEAVTQRERKERCIRSIQSIYRGHLARIVIREKKAQRQVFVMKSTRRIYCWMMKLLILKSRAQKRVVTRRNAMAEIIQTAWKVKVAKDYLSRIRTRKEAIESLYKVAERLQEQDIAEVDKREAKWQHQCAMQIQNAYRSKKCKEIFLKRKFPFPRRAAANRIQNAFRQHRARRVVNRLMLRKEFSEGNNASVRIQRVVRGHQGRKILFKAAAAKALQAFKAKQKLSCRKIWEAYLHHLARIRLTRLKHIANRKKASIITRHWRRHAAGVKVQRMLKAVDQLTLIEKIRNEVAQTDDATTAQAMQHVQEALRHISQIKIKTAYQYHKARMVLLRLKDLYFSPIKATLIQCNYRAHLSKRKLQERKDQKRNAFIHRSATILQCAIRLFLSKKFVASEQEAKKIADNEKRAFAMQRWLAENEEKGNDNEEEKIRQLLLMKPHPNTSQIAEATNTSCDCFLWMPLPLPNAPESDNGEPRELEALRLCISSARALLSSLDNPRSSMQETLLEIELKRIASKLKRSNLEYDSEEDNDKDHHDNINPAAFGTIDSLVKLVAVDCCSGLMFHRRQYTAALRLMIKARDDFLLLRKRSSSANANARNISGISWMHHAMCLSQLGRGKEALRMAVKGVEALTRSRLAPGRNNMQGDWIAAQGWYNMSLIARDAGDNAMATAAAVSSVRCVQEAPNAEKNQQHNKRTLLNLQKLLASLPEQS